MPHSTNLLLERQNGANKRSTQIENEKRAFGSFSERFRYIPDFFRAEATIFRTFGIVPDF